MTEPMTDERLNELEALTNSFPKPWEAVLLSDDHDHSYIEIDDRIEITVLVTDPGDCGLTGLISDTPGLQERAHQALVFCAKTQQTIPDLIAEVRRLRAEIEALKNPWQPIETAPKDGSFVLTYAAGYEDGQCYAVQHYIDAWAGLDWYHNCDEYGTGAEWWMPLPQPPKIEESEVE